MAKSKLELIRKTKKIEFKYDGSYYIFERRSEGKLSYDFIWNTTGEKIYGPFHGDSTEEGEKIYKALIKKLNRKN
jgi:hypothetical protein